MESINYSELSRVLNNSWLYLDHLFEDISQQMSNDNILLIDRTFLKTIIETIQDYQSFISDKLETCKKLKTMDEMDKIKYLLTY